MQPIRYGGHGTMNERYMEICERLGWRVIECSGGGFELEKWSPAGEDIVFDVDADGFADSVKSYYDNFDVDEHVELWIEGRGRRGVPSTVRELLEDAEAIDAMLKELAEALFAADSEVEGA